MADENNPQAEPEKKEPTLAEVQEIAQNAAKVAAEAKSKAEAREGVEQSIREDTEKSGINLSDDDCKKIADATIAGLEARGAFEEVVEEENPPTPAQSQGTAGGTTEQQSPAAPPAQSAPPVPSVPPTDTQPKKKTLAERFVGRK